MTISLALVINDLYESKKPRSVAIHDISEAHCHCSNVFFPGFHPRFTRFLNAAQLRTDSVPLATVRCMWYARPLILLSVVDKSPRRSAKQL